MLILYLILAILLISVAYSNYSLAPWFPSRAKDYPRICKLANFKENDTFYDLGCGTGSLLLYAAKNHKIKVIGLELSIPLYFLCKIREIGTKNVNFQLKNILHTNLGNADVVYLFSLWKGTLKKIREKMERELKPGTRVISYSFPIDGWVPEKIDKPSDQDLSIYLYIIK